MKIKTIFKNGKIIIPEGLVILEGKEIFIEFNETNHESSQSDDFEQSFIEALLDSERNNEISDWDSINIDETL